MASASVPVVVEQRASAQQSERSRSQAREPASTASAASTTTAPHIAAVGRISSAELKVGADAGTGTFRGRASERAWGCYMSKKETVKWLVLLAVITVVLVMNQWLGDRLQDALDHITARRPVLPNPGFYALLSERDTQPGSVEPWPAPLFLPSLRSVGR